MNLDTLLRRFPSKTLKVWLGFSLLLIIKYKRKEINWGGNLRKNEPAPCYLGNSQHIPIAKDAQLRKFIVRKMCSGEKSKYVAKSFAEEMGHVTHRSRQSSQQKPVIEMRWSRKDLWRTVLFNGVDSCGILRRPKRFLKCCISRNTASLNWRGYRQDEVKAVCWICKIQRSGLIELLSVYCSIRVTLNKSSMTSRVEP